MEGVQFLSGFWWLFLMFFEMVVVIWALFGRFGLKMVVFGAVAARKCVFFFCARVYYLCERNFKDRTEWQQSKTLRLRRRR